MANQFARELRRNVTDAEKKLWQQLRLLKSTNRHFRRQVPIGGSIADFACHRCGLVVELDGGQHSEPQNLAVTKRALLSFSGWATVLSGSGMLMYLKILKVSLT